MLENLIFSLNSTMPLFALMVLGYLLFRTRFLNENFVSTANTFVYNVTLPVMLFSDLAATDIRHYIHIESCRFPYYRIGGFFEEF